MHVSGLKHKVGSAYGWSKSNKRKIFLVISVILFPTIIALFMAYVERYSFDHPIIEAFQWISKCPVAFLINWLIIFTMSAIIWLITKKNVVAVATVSIFSVICSLVNYFKLTIRGEPVYPGDLLFPGEATNIVGATKLIVPSSIYAFSSIVIALIIISHFVKPPKISMKKRLISLFVILILCGVSFPLFYANTKVQKFIGIEDAIWNQKYNYEKNGFFGAFLMQARYLIVDKPDGYDKKNAQKLLKDNAVPTLIANTPNVIVIMDESFSDPTRLPGVTFNIDPMESYKRVQQQSIYGNLLVEPFGGNTANTEFEALTGFSMNALPNGVAYQQYIKRQVPSLASLLKAQGYTTEAIHPYVPWFWNRTMVYPLIGIDDFISVKSFAKSDYKGRYVSDSAAVDRVISEYEAKKSGGKPYFAHLVTMQNHGWYDTDRYKGQQEVLASSNDVDKQTILELNTYAQGVKDAGDALLKLTEYFKQIDEPTYIMYFGDHLPKLGWDYGVYRSSGLVGKGEFTDEEYTKLHSTPFVIWSNTRTTGTNIGTINANFLSPLLLKSAGITMSDYFSFLNTQMDGAKACTKTVCLGKNGKYINISDSKVKPKLTNQAILQYYYLFD